MLNKKIALITVLAAAVVLPVFAQSDEDPSQDTLQDSGSSPEITTTPADPDLQRTLVIVDGAHTYNLNPHTAVYSSEAQILTGLYEGLYSYDPVTLDPVPALAASYKLSRSKLRYTFTLVDGAVFSDGTPINAATIRDSWLTLLADKNAQFASLFDCIKGAREYRTGTGRQEDVAITARGATTLIVELTEPAEHFLRILCHHAFSAVSGTPGVYSGAFMVKSYDNGRLEMVKNPKYRDAIHVALPGITVLQSDDESENTHLFNTGAADWLSGNFDVSKLLNQDTVKLAAEFGTEYFFFSCRSKPWDNVQFRNALVAAVPWKELRSKAMVPAATLVYPLSKYPEVNGLTDTDAEEAAQMLADAKKAAGMKADAPLVITIASSDGKYMQEEINILKKAWESLGITVTVQKTPADRYLDSIDGWTTADVFNYSWIGDFADPIAFLELFRGGSALNRTFWDSRDYDALLKQAASASTSEEHYRLLAQAEQLLLDGGVIMPVAHQVSLHAIDTGMVGGWHTNSLDIHPLKYLYFKETHVSLPNLVMAEKPAEAADLF